jgi:cell division protein FtsI (penicillin-binding protein 3)
VVIKNKPFAKKYYGAAVAGPVFKEVADKLISLIADEEKTPAPLRTVADSSDYLYAGNSSDMKMIMKNLDMNYQDSSGTSEYNVVADENYQAVMKEKLLARNSMPDVKGMGLKDVLFLLENKNVKVQTKGKGKVKTQSVNAGAPLAKGQTVVVELN